MQVNRLKSSQRLALYLPFLVALGAFVAQTNATQAASFKIGDQIIVSAISLNVRADAGTSAKIIGTVRSGESGRIIEGPKASGGANWWKIDYASGPDGWSAEEYLRHSFPSSPSPTASLKFKAGDRVSVTSASLNVRNGASLLAKVVGTHSRGAIGTVVAGPNKADGNTWWLVRYDNGADGWSAESFLQRSSNPEAPVASSDIRWGAYAGNNPGDLEKFEKLVGKEADIQAVFVGWNDPFPSEIARRLKDAGKTLLIFWEPYSTSLESIDAGRSDEYMKKFAADSKAHGGPIMMAPLHEMNGNWNPWSGYGWDNQKINSPALIISVWRRMYDIFKDADNVKFAWAVNNDSVPNVPENSINTYYPGDAYVDYVGLDGFNFGSPWQSFDQVFEKAVKSVAIYKKPIYLFSIASAPGKDKDEWIKYGLGTAIKHYPGLAGWVWFNQNGPDRNWSINSDPDSLNAFRSIIPL